MATKAQRKVKQARRVAHAKQTATYRREEPVVHYRVTVSAPETDSLKAFAMTLDGEPVITTPTRGRCLVCNTRHKLRKSDGLLTAHPRGLLPCSGAGTRPADD